VSTSLRLLILIAGAFAAVVLFFVFRDDDDNGTQAQTATQQSTTGSSTTTVQEPTPKVFRIDATVPGIKRVSVEEGRRVIMIVVADSTQEVHLHGYDLKSMVTAERPGGFNFRARLPGRFEIEFEGSGEQIAELTVTP
jgi:hypothetical protein